MLKVAGKGFWVLLTDRDEGAGFEDLAGGVKVWACCFWAWDEGVELEEL